MNRNQLKQLWFNLDRTNVKEVKQIIVELNFGHVEIMNDGPNGYSSHKSYQGKNSLQYALDSKEYQSGNYQLFIKQNDNTS